MFRELVGANSHQVCKIFGMYSEKAMRKTSVRGINTVLGFFLCCLIQKDIKTILDRKATFRPHKKSPAGVIETNNELMGSQKIGKYLNNM
jgi:hypothetical protein